MEGHQRWAGDADHKSSLFPSARHGTHGCWGVAILVTVDANPLVYFVGSFPAYYVFVTRRDIQGGCLSIGSHSRTFSVRQGVIGRAVGLRASLITDSVHWHICPGPAVAIYQHEVSSARSRDQQGYYIL